MKSELLNFRRLFPLAAAALLLIAGAANPQTDRLPLPTNRLPTDRLQTDRIPNPKERIQSVMPSETVIRAGAVTEKSSAADLKAVGKEVAPGVLEIDPDSVRGKRLIVPPRGEQTARIACIGKWKNGECKGIYIEW